MTSERPPRDPILREAMAKMAVPEPAVRPFVHLRVHSAYSLLEGALPLEKIVCHAVEGRGRRPSPSPTPTICSARWNSPRRRSKDGVQPIIGCQLDIDVRRRNQEASRRPPASAQGPELFPLVLIAANEAGYANLVRLVSRAYLDNAAGRARPCLAATGWRELAGGLICLTGRPARSDRRRAARRTTPALAESRLLTLKALFGDRLYVELQRHRRLRPRASRRR